MRKMSISYKIHTELLKGKNGEFFVQDRIVFESGNEKIIRRFEGDEVKAKRYARSLAANWKKTISKRPSV